MFKNNCICTDLQNEYAKLTLNSRSINFTTKPVSGFGWCLSLVNHYRGMIYPEAIIVKGLSKTAVIKETSTTSVVRKHRIQKKISWLRRMAEHNRVQSVPGQSF